MTSNKPNTPRGNKSKRRREAAAQRRAARQTGLSANRVGEPTYQQDWARSRKGADAARGFQFQHAVGALLAAQVADGTLDGTLVPEGLDDMTIEGAADINVQIKGRRADRGPFPPAVAAQHIIDAWTAGQAKANKAATQWVIVEGGVVSPEDFTDLHRPLTHTLISGSPLHVALTRRAARELGQAEFDDLLARTAVYGETWNAIEERTAVHVSNLAGDVDRAGRTLIMRSMQIEIAIATSANATRDAEGRAALDKAQLVQHIVATAELIDVEGLNEALRSGVCSLFDWSVGFDTGDRFYEGESTQPGHVASGLVIERPDLLDQVITGTEENRPVILTGPSGIGKSAVLFTVPRFLPGVTWFRVDRLQTDDDANLMMRLARAYGATVDHPVGFLVDGAGTGQLTGWSLARTRAATRDGVLLFASARNEDLVQLGSLAGTATIDVVLDETSAAAIYEGLKRRGATTALHWREAYEQSHGLTLEFTYLLTQGKRLHEVISDQIEDRVRQDRGDELDLLALVAVAHTWGATLELDRAADTLGAQGATLRTPIRRLAQEHLLVETDGILSGLHPVRSSAISQSIHTTPPPTIRATFSAVLRTLDDRQLPRFIVAALRDHPDFTDTVLDAATHELLTTGRLAAFLQGLRLADSEQAIREWLTIVDEQGIKRASHLTVVMLALGGTDMGPSTPQAIRTALDRMAQVVPGRRRDDLASRVGSEAIARITFDSEPKDAQALVATLHGWDHTLTPPPDAASTPLMRALASAPLETLTETLSTFHDHDDELGRALVELLGGETAMLDKIRHQEPWLLKVEINDDPDGPIGFATVLHVSDDLQGDARDRCVALARTLLRLLPSIAKPDVEALWPGGHRIEFGGHAFSLSGLLREYDHNSTEVAWNQARTTIAQTLLGTPDSVRLAVAEPVLRDLAAWFRDLVNRWARAEFPGSHDQALLQEAIRLNDAGYAMNPGFGGADIDLGAITHTTRMSSLDPLSNMVTNVTELYRRLRTVTNPAGEAMYVRDQVLGGAQKCLTEPWHLINEGEQATSSLNEIITTARLLADVLAAHTADEAATPVTRRSAKGGPRGQALERAAHMAKRLRDSTVDGRRQEIAEAVAAAASGCVVDVIAGEEDGRTRFVVLVEGPPLYEYVGIQDSVVAAVQKLNQTLDSFLILPTRQGKRFERMGIRLTRTPLPALDVEGWEDLLPEAHPCDLARLIQTSVQSLQVLSGITELTDHGQEHQEVISAAEEATARFHGAFNALTALDDDLASEAAHELAEIVERVNAEIAGTSKGETFAAAIYRGLSGEVTEEFARVSLLNLCALAWPVDEQGVRELLTN